MILRRPLADALLVVFFYLLDLVCVDYHFGSTTLVDYLTGDFVRHGLSHGVAVYFIAEHVESRVYRSAGEADVCGVGERIVQILGEAVCVFYALGGHGRFLPHASLRAVSFIAYADDVGAVAQQTGTLLEFLDGGEEHTSRRATAQQIAECFAAVGLQHSVVAYIIFGIEHQFRQLVIKVIPIGDE